MAADELIVHGAREHNLKDVTVRLPRNALICITGLSGSGKSSLAFDTIYAEGQRRYVESLSAYARQFLQMMEKPDVDSIDGLSPAISIDQKTTSRNPRSTVGTVTEIYDYLRLLYARIGKPHCPVCGRPISGQSQESIVDQILQLEDGPRFTVNGPVVRDRKGEYKDVFEHLQAEGFSRVKVDGEQYLLEEGVPELDKKFKHTIEVVVDRLVMKADLRTRLSQSVETATQLADGLVTIDVIGGKELTFSENFACPEHGVGIPELEPAIFPFNSAQIRERIEEYMSFRPCPACKGARLKPEVLAVTVGGKNIHELTKLSVSRALGFLDELELTETEQLIGARIVKEIRERLTFLDNVGVGYLQLDRAAKTLSGGEAQRLRLATQIGSQLVGVLYILDEPSIGLHQRDNDKLIRTLTRLRDLGNTVMVVEHDEQMMRESDWLVDMGPGAGEHCRHGL